MFVISSHFQPIKLKTYGRKAGSPTIRAEYRKGLHSIKFQPCKQILDQGGGANHLAYDDTAEITTVKCFIVQVRRVNITKTFVCSSLTAEQSKLKCVSPPSFSSLD